ncbi:hypothetical protein SRABI27_00620 [Pedobacter sp. Bi27]|uniref:DUF3999 family protein n=2 Tax=unclassified Pedobacter TaxID=2628915 RepID=UPI001D49FD60|nr:DUF3999 family protein [Pedobacter sp. Bi27]CAH0154592.1 hypothetical protein SRABI126_00621 [Pedobacter sp. Bi126]CAH0155102.1 hypothetical protein SRABI27_00620 [Pedobacter sp. Bi27]CAH0203694.1 hypothetical protein SRABI36_02059 [Pedobacter sp. Bi36]
MMLKLKINLFTLLLLCVTIANAQTNTYKFKRSITGVNSVWHKMALPNDLYKKANAGFEDLRIFGINGKDTLEVPYLLKQRADKVTTNDIAFKQINQSTNPNGYYYTFQSPGINLINQINLAFKQENFDWKVNLEGSNDNKEWFSLLTDYRILSIKNNDTDYHFTKLNFPDSKYQYFRIAVKSPVQPELLEAKISKTDTVKGTYQEVKYQSFDLKNDVSKKETIINVTLANPVPLSNLRLNAQSDFDFYRSIKIEYATDGFKTDKGIQYNYANLYEGTISSLEEPAFNFANTITSRLKITIQNNDNKPLRLNTLQLKGNIYEIIARFDEPKDEYALYYGNEKATGPLYEIEKFESKIPNNLTSVNIGTEQRNPAYSIKTEKPLFENKAWLWVLMAVIIALLGWFSFKMLRN